jgi:hypothetical protein
LSIGEALRGHPSIAASSRAIRRCHRNETPSVVAVCVCNPDCSPAGINC